MTTQTLSNHVRPYIFYTKILLGRITACATEGGLYLGEGMTNFNWYFTREEIDNNSPSREDGVPLATEVRYRREGARLIINASNTLGLYPTPSLSFSLHLSLSLSLS